MGDRHRAARTGRAAAARAAGERGASSPRSSPPAKSRNVSRCGQAGTAARPTACRCAASGRRTSGSHGTNSRPPTTIATEHAGEPASRCRVAPHDPELADADDGDEEERPVLRVEQRGGDQRRPSASRPIVGRSTARRDREVPEQHEHHREHVHARFGRVPDRVRGRGDDEHAPRPTPPRRSDRRAGGRRSTRAASIATPSTPDSARDGDVAGAEARRSSRGAAGSRAAARRRGAAPPARSESGSAGDVDGQRLVEPEIRRRRRSAARPRRRGRRRRRSRSRAARSRAVRDQARPVRRLGRGRGRIDRHLLTGRRIVRAWRQASDLRARPRAAKRSRLSLDG